MSTVKSDHFQIFVLIKQPFKYFLLREFIIKNVYFGQIFVILEDVVESNLEIRASIDSYFICGNLSDFAMDVNRFRGSSLLNSSELWISFHFLVDFMYWLSFSNLSQ